MELKNEIQLLDDFKVRPVTEICKLAQDPSVEWHRPAKDFLLRFLDIPSTYYKRATEDLQHRMFVEGVADKKDQVLRISQDSDSGEVMGLGPALNNNVTMSSVMSQLKGDIGAVRGSLIDRGKACAFMRLDKMTVGGEEIESGYNVILSQMFNRGLSFRPSLSVVVCTNGLVEDRQTGSEYNLSLKLLTDDYIKMASATIPTVVSDMAVGHKNLISTAQNTKITSSAEFIKEVYGRNLISKGLMLRGLKIQEVIHEGLTSEDPAYPTSCSTLWDIAQILSYSVRVSDNASRKISAEASIMKMLHEYSKN